MSEPSLLIVDDDSEYLSILSESLSCDFAVQGVDTFIKAEQAIEDIGMFDIALIDEHVKDQLGSDWIESQQNRNSAKSFVLYSGLATENAILRGLECGADDFLAKPFSLKALNNKLVKLIDYQQQINRYESKIIQKESVITASMTQAAKYGSCMQLIARLNHCFSYEQLRDQIFSFLKSMGLKGCLAFYPISSAPIYYHSVNGCCSPVETTVIELLKTKSRLFRFGNRTIFNHSLASLLILNFEEDSVETDVYIDALASVIECIGARMEFISYKDSLVEVQQQIEQAVETTKKMVAESKYHSQEVMSEIVQNIATSFHVLDMTLEQEDFLTNLVHKALKKHSQDDLNFIAVTELLDHALHSIQSLKHTSSDETSLLLDSDDDLDEDVLF